MRTYLLPLIAVAAGCSHKGSGREPDEYLGCANDETWIVFDERAPRTDDAQATSFKLPGDGAALPFTPKPTFAWEKSKTLPGQPNGSATCQKCTSCGMLGTSHEPPLSGDAWDLQLSASGAVAWRAITTLQTWTPPDTAWNAWRGKSVSLTATRVTLKSNEVLEGPFRAAKPLVFSIGN